MHRISFGTDKTLRLLVLAFIGCALSWTGCSSGGGGGTIVSTLAGTFAPSGTSVTADSVRLTGASVGDMVTVDVVIGGPTTSSDLYSFAFDIVLSDPTVAQYVVGSASFGTALTMSGGQQGQVLVADNGGTLTLGVTKLGGGSGNGVTSGEPDVVSLTFQVLKAGATTLTFAGSAPNPPAALDSTGSVVGSIVFDSVTASITGT